MSTSYRQDIDGLRLIAVLAVIFYHLLGDVLPAGYLGVDIFFTISGFVITRKLLREYTKTGAISFAAFFLGRMKRLLPALLLVIFVTMFGISFIAGDFGDQDFVEIINNAGLTAIYGVSNFVLYAGQADYFSQNAELNPFTHTWSLAVEEQFYLVLPLIILAAMKWAGRGETGTGHNAVAGGVIRLLSWLLLLLGFASFVGALIVAEIDQALGFYMLPFRFWELALGCLLAIAAHKSGAQKIKPATGWHGALSLILLGVVIGSFFVDGQIPTVPLQAIAVLATAGMIHFGEQARLTGSLLSSGVMTYGGRLSYSLYLWHWPFIVLAKWTVGLTPLAVIVIGLLTVSSAALSYHFVESPLRRMTIRATPLRGIGKIQAAVLAVGLVIFFGNDFVTEKLEFHAPGLMGIKPSISWGDSLACHDQAVTAKMADPDRECLVPLRDAAHPHALFLVGDSHAAQLIFGVDEALQGTGFQRRYLWSGKTDEIFPYTFFGDTDPVGKTIARIETLALPGDIVLFTYHRGWAHDNRDNQIVGPNDALNARSILMRDNLDAVIGRLKARKIDVILSLDGPLIARRVSVHSCALQNKWSGTSVCAISRAQDENTRMQQQVLFTQLAAKHSNVSLYDPFDALFGGRDVVDVIDKDGNWLMYDYNHISLGSSLKLAPSFRTMLDQKWDAKSAQK